MKLADFIAAKARQPDPSSFYAGFRQFVPIVPIQYDERPVSERFRSWPFVCADRNAVALSNLPLRFYRDGSGPASRGKSRKAMDLEDATEVDSHPFRSVLDCPNPILDECDLLWITAVQLQMSANSYWYVVRNQLQQPLELWPLPATRVQVIYGGTGGLVQRFELRYASEVVEFDPDEIVWFRRPSPVDPLIGHSPTDGVKDAIELNTRFSEYEQALLENFAIPSHVISPKQPIQRPQAAQMKQEWDSKYRGWTNRGKSAVAPFPLDVLNLTQNNRDMQFREGVPLIKEEILAGYGIPEPIVSANGSTFSNLEQGLRLWAEFTIDPLGRKIASVINRDIMPMYGSRERDPMAVKAKPETFVAFDSAVVDDEEIKQRVLAGFVAAGIKTQDEARAELGMDPLTDEQRATMPQQSDGATVHDLRGASMGDEPDGTGPVTQDVTLAELSKALVDAAKIDDLETVNMLRAAMAAKIGQEPPADLKELPSAEEGQQPGTAQEEPKPGREKPKDDKRANAVEGDEPPAEDWPLVTKDASTEFEPRTNLEGFMYGLWPDTAEKLGLRRVGHEVRDQEFIDALQGVFEDMFNAVCVRSSSHPGFVKGFSTKDRDDTTAALLLDLFDEHHWGIVLAETASIT